MRYLVVLIGFLLFSFPQTVYAVVLNELMVTPSSGSDWVELYNLSPSDVDLTGWTLTDTAASVMKNLSGTISANGFVTFDVGTRLNIGGDTVKLKDNTSSEIDTYTYSSNPGTDITLGRSPDGEDWGTLSTPSKGSLNGGAVPTATPIPPTSTPTPEPTSTPKPTATPKPTPTIKTTATPKPIKEPTATPTPKTTAKSQTTSTSSQNTSSSKTTSSAKIPSNLLGESTSSAKNNSPSNETPTQISPTQSVNIPYVAGGVAFLLIGAGLLYIRFRTNEKISN